MHYNSVCTSKAAFIAASLKLLRKLQTSDVYHPGTRSVAESVVHGKLARSDFFTDAKETRVHAFCVAVPPLLQQFVHEASCLASVFCRCMFLIPVPVNFFVIAINEIYNIICKLYPKYLQYGYEEELFCVYIGQISKDIVNDWIREQNKNWKPITVLFNKLHILNQFKKNTKFSLSDLIYLNGAIVSKLQIFF